MAILDFSKAKSSGAPTPQESSSQSPQTDALNLLLRLQQSLDAKELIEELAQLIGREIGLDGYRYQPPSEAIACQSGHQNRHELAYTLKIEDDELGEFKLYRARPFEESESQYVENLLALLVYPLRNALRYQQALRSAYTDPLTGLCNRSNMQHQLQREVSLSRRENRPMSLVIVDIDNFKRVNDRFGHLSGDQVIRCVAQQLRESLRDFDLIFRYGGEEFVLVLSGADAACAESIAERLRAAVAAHTCKLDGGGEVSPTISLGVSQLRDDEDPMALFARADEAMYQAKGQGRNAVCVC
ncbi:MAG: GGDEF domain-containing protein [Acidihalobacter sp.]|jgi:diguanylate cyclase (GGDEF)-like protein